MAEHLFPPCSIKLSQDLPYCDDLGSLDMVGKGCLSKQDSRGWQCELTEACYEALEGLFYMKQSVLWDSACVLQEGDLDICT